MRFPRFRKPAPATAAPAATGQAAYGTAPACTDLNAMPRLFSPLIAEMMALYCHTRQIGALSQDEHCPDEYQLAARSIIHHILEGWQNQTDGLGSIDQLLLEPRTSRATGFPAPEPLGVRAVRTDMGGAA